MAGTTNGFAAAAPGGDDGRFATGKLALGSWMLFEWSAQPFYSLITTFLFAPYFANGFIGDPVRGQQIWAYTAAFAGLAVAICSPVLGAFADSSGRRKPWIIIASLFFIAGMSSLWIAEPGRPELLYLVLIAYAVAAVAAELNAVFVNAMMPGLVPASQYGRTSGMSAAIGYLGGLASLVVVAGLLVADTSTGRTLFGLAPMLDFDAASRQGDRFIGPFCAIWFLIFVLPLLLFTPDRRAPGASSAGGMTALRQTLTELPQHGNVLKFLIARMLFVDGLGAVFAFGGIYGAAQFGWQAFELGLFGIILIVTAMIGAAVGGWLDDKIGARRVILAALVIALIATLGVLSVDKTHVLFMQAVAAKEAGTGFLASIGERVFVLFAGFVGLVAGPLNASSRSFMAHISPPERITQFFGLFAFSGKATSFIAPLLVGGLTAATGNQRYGVAVVLVFLTAGLLLMLRVQGDAVRGESVVAVEPAPAVERDWLGGSIVTILLIASLWVIATT